MSKDAELENLIKLAFIKGEEGTTLSNDPLEKAKSRLNTKKPRYIIDIKECLYKLKYGIMRPAAVICCFALIAVLAISFVQPVKAAAQEFVQMIYVAVKGADGKYEAVQVPHDGKYESSRSVARSLNGEELKKVFGYAVFVPEELDNGYKLRDKNPRVSQSVETGEKQVNASFLKGESQLMLAVQNNDMLMRDARDKGDNGRMIEAEGMNLYYCEFPYEVYPFISDGDGGGTFDITQKPLEIITIHSLTWENNGLYYRLWDLTTGDASEEILENSAKIIIEHQQ